VPSSLSNDNEVSHCLCRFWLRLRIFTVHTARHLLAFFLRDKLKNCSKAYKCSGRRSAVVCERFTGQTSTCQAISSEWFTAVSEPFTEVTTGSRVTWSCGQSQTSATAQTRCCCLKGMGCWWYDIRKYSFCYRVVNVWNSLPDYVVEADSVNSFKIGWINTGPIKSLFSILTQN